MNTSIKRSTLTGAVICTIFAAQIYAFKWAVFFFMPTTIWRVADLCGNVGSFLGKGFYGAMAACIRGGAVISIAMLLRDAYIIAKPLFDGKSNKQDSKSGGIGGIISIIYTLLFIVMIYAANDGELKSASITLWPVISVALCIAARVMLKRRDKESGAIDHSAQASTMD